MNRTHIFTALGILISLGIALYALLSHPAPRIAVIDNQRLFDGFDMKAEYEARLREIENRQRHVLDSIELEVRKLRMSPAGQVNRETALAEERLIGEYRERSALFRENLGRATEQFDQNIWKQIEAIMKDFGAEHGYDYVLGKSTYDDIYAFPESADATEQAIEFLNQHYQGTAP